MTSLDGVAAVDTGNKNNNRSYDLFISQMTFAHRGSSRNCICDDCDDLCEPIPPSIAEAVRNYKRTKLTMEAHQTNRALACQERALVERVGDVSLWRWVMPPGSDPIVEYGNSHRIVIVEAFHKGSIVKSIGKGILGSSDEESSRKIVSWEQGKAYLIPSNGGKALGWFHNNTPNQTEADADKKSTCLEKGAREPVVVYMIKVTPECVIARDTIDKNCAKWVSEVITIVRKYLPDTRRLLNGMMVNDMANKQDAIATDGSFTENSLLLSDEEFLKLRSVVFTLLEREKNEAR